MKARSPLAPPPADPLDEDALPEALDEDELGRARSATPDLSALPIAGVTRRRIGFLVGALVSAWILIVFARQVGEASAASARVDALEAANAALAGDVAALEREYQLIQRQEWIVQQARGYRLGSPGEIPFGLAAAPSLSPDAPGSAAVRLGASADDQTPLESWLSLLFGPSR